MKNFNELPESIQAEIKDHLRAYDDVDVFFEKGENDMRKFYVEYVRDGENAWCVAQADRAEDVEYTVKMYGFEIVRISEI